MRRAGGVAPIVVLALCGASAPGTARDEDGSAVPPPAAFVERSLHILHLPLLDFGAAQPYAPGPGQVEWILTAAYATTYSTTWHARRFHLDPARRGTPLSQDEADAIHATYPNDQVLFVDGEALRTSLTARYGISPAFSVSIEVPYIARGLTGLESFVSKFHKAFGVDENGRDEFPSGHFTTMLQSPGGPMSLTEFQPSSGIGDVAATVSWRRPRSRGGWTLGADLTLKAPTGFAANANGSGGWDEGFLAFAVWERGRWTLEGDGSLVFPGRWKVPVPLDPSPTVGRLVVSGIYGFTSKTRAGLSVTWAQSPFRRHAYSSLSQAGVEAGLGVEHDFGRRAAARLMLTEQLPSAGDRADFSLIFGLRYR